MTELGIFLAKKSINKAEVSRRSGISKARLTQLSNSEKTRLSAEELYLIALSLNISPAELLNTVCKNVRLPEQR
jgi:transcriptional regulator with XRE-family HTH domain